MHLVGPGWSSPLSAVLLDCPSLRSGMAGHVGQRDMVTVTTGALSQLPRVTVLLYYSLGFFCSSTGGWPPTQDVYMESHTVVLG